MSHRGSDAKPIVIDKQAARRLAISCQCLAGLRPAPDETRVMAVLRALRYLQLDPVSVVAPSHELVLWSRLGTGAAPLLDDLLWQRRVLFEYWVYNAAIVLTEDYRMHRAFMDAYPVSRRITAWLAANDALRTHILDRLAAEGSLPTSAFEDLAAVDWQSSGWTKGRNVERMLQTLWLKGAVMVAGRAGGERLWGLTDMCIPPQVRRTALSMDEARETALEHALCALGIARAADLQQHVFRFTAQMPSLRAALGRLQQKKRVVTIKIENDPSPHAWFMHVDTLPTLKGILAGRWTGRTALLSPFDSLISHRGRTEQLWHFHFRSEMYLPKAERQYGYYLMPILHGDALVGRLAPVFDRRRQTLSVEGLYLEPGVGAGAELRRKITAEIEALAAYVGAQEIAYGERVPNAWRSQLQGA